MSDTVFMRYKTAGGWDCFINPECVSHIYPKTGWTVVTMRNGYEYVFDMPMQDFIERLAKDMTDATSSR